MLNLGQIRREYERAQANLRDAESGKTQEYWQGQVSSYWNCISLLENEKSIDDYYYDLEQAMDVLRILRTFLCCHPKEIAMGNGCYSDPDDSTGAGFHKVFNDILIAFDGFATKYEQENATSSPAAEE